MARKSNQLTTAFDTIKDAQPRNGQRDTDVTQSSNTNTKTSKGTQDVIQNVIQGLTMDEVIGKLSEKVETRKQKQRVEDTHKRSTFLFRRDLSDRLDELARIDGSRGFKTMFLNEAIEAFLDGYEKEIQNQ